MHAIRTRFLAQRSELKAWLHSGLLLALPALYLLISCVPLQAAEPAPRTQLVLAGPPAAVSFPLLHMMESGALAEVADEVSFRLWSNPDQLRALALDGKADFMAMPTNVAANLYNRGVDLQLTNVSVWGVLWIVSRNPDLNTLADFRGEEIAVPFRAASSRKARASSVKTGPPWAWAARGSASIRHTSAINLYPAFRRPGRSVLKSVVIFTFLGFPSRQAR